MKLEELLKYQNIVIQCHDDPDPDAVASGFGVYRYLEEHGKTPSLIYGGDKEIQKSNLVLMVKLLDIPIKYVQKLEKQPDLLVCVDCQYGEENVALFPAGVKAVIDHHKQAGELPALSEVRPSYGACATVVWDMLREAGMSVKEDSRLATALYYGLFMDTGRLQELGHPKDKDLRDELELICERSLLFQLQNCNLSGEELRIAGQALARCEYLPQYRFALAEAKPCDPNILGIISDMMLETDIVDTCVSFSMLKRYAKLSVRSCVREVKADELTRYLTEGLGSGGGHAQKAGGRMGNKALREARAAWGTKRLRETVQAVLRQRIADYMQSQVILHSGTDEVPDLSGEPLYEKLRLPIGYVRTAELYPVGTPICVRMLEGDFAFDVQEDTYLIFGVESEVYRNDEAYFLAHNDPSDEPFVFHGEYAPTVRANIRSTAGLEAKPLAEYVKTCVPKAGSRVRAREIKEGRVKVFRKWDKENYMLGLPGDWLVTRAEDPKNCYIIQREIFAKSYAPCPPEERG